jgi:hypothetical protein
MKNLILISLIVSVGLSSAFGAEKKAKTSAHDSITTSQSAPLSTGGPRWGLGMATYSITGLFGASLAGIMSFDPKNSLQPMFTIAHTAGSFQFDIGALFRHSMIQGTNTGFHIGGGFGLGTTPGTTTTTATGARTTSNDLAVAISGVAGFKYTLPGTEDVILYADAGPVIQLVDGDADFHLSPFSGFFGATLVYLF